MGVASMRVGVASMGVGLLPWNVCAVGRRKCLCGGGMLVSLVECHTDFSSFYSERGGFPHSQSMTSLISEVCCLCCVL